MPRLIHVLGAIILLIGTVLFFLGLHWFAVDLPGIQTPLGFYFPFVPN